MGMVTFFYAIAAGLIAGFVGGLLTVIIRRAAKPKSSCGWDVLAFTIGFCFFGLLAAAIVVVIMVKAFTG